jgi:hypothetical protein
MVDDIKERDNSGNITRKQLMHREQNKAAFRIIQNVIGEKYSKGIKHLDIPDEVNKDTYVRITD